MITVDSYRFGTAFTNTYSIDLDGSNEYITMGNVAAFNLAAGTVSAWVKTPGKAGNIIVSKANFSTARNGYYFYTTGGNALNFGVSSAVAANTEASASFAAFLNTWTHVAATWGDGNLKIYINGSLVDTEVQTVANNSASSNFIIGSHHALANFYDGLVDEVSIWNTALALAKIQEIYNSGDPTDLDNHSSVANLVSWWRLGDDPLDDATGGTGTIRDQVSTNHGTPTNTEAADKTADAP